jgi:PTS system N-acetylglucosamine-specific IIB component
VELAEIIFKALGEPQNVKSLEAAANRLRFEVDDPSAVDVDELKARGAYGVIISGHVVQVVFGAKSGALAKSMNLIRQRVAAPVELARG